MIDIATFGAHILSATAEKPELDHREIFWLSQRAATTGPTAIRGGVPVIAPQFADLMDGPKHGWARTATWTVRDGDKGGYLARVARDGLALELRATPTLDGIDAVLTAENTGKESKRIQLGLHPYFRVGDVEKVRLLGLEGADLYDRAHDSHALGQQETTFDGEYDRICRGSAPCLSIVDPVLGRRIDVRGLDMDAFVVWNPGEQLAGGIADIHPGGWREFLCVEPARLGAGLDGFELVPRDKAQVGMGVQVSALEEVPEGVEV